METQQQLTTFDDDKAVIQEHFPAENILSGQRFGQHSDMMQHSVISFLERPQVIESVTWTANMDRNKILFDKYVPDLAFTTMVRNKLDGFTSFRATCVVRLQVNAQPFQGGRLIMSAIPMPTLINPRDDYIRQNVTLLQAVNNVQLDISKQTEVTLRIPFISPFNSYDLIHGQYPWARVIVAVYGPLNQVSNPDLQVLMWAHFEEISMGAPTSAKQQSGVVPARPSNETVSGLRGLESGTGSLIGSLGSGLSSVLSGITSTLGSGSGTLSGLSTLLGFSKPQVQEVGCPVYIRPTVNFGNVDGQDTSHVLAMTKANNVTSIQGLGGTSMDETSFEYIKRIPQFIDEFSFSKSDNFGDILWRCNVTPSFYLKDTLKVKAGVEPGVEETDGFTAFQPTTLGYISSAFMYWTGSIVYTFKFVKTDYHSGRVEVSFHPFVQASDEKPDMSYVYRCIIDLREKTEASFTVPFISPQPWKVVQQIDPLSKTVKWSEAGPAITGYVCVRAITPLYGNEIVQDTITCLVETRAGDDFRLQAPCKSWFVPVTVRRVQSAKEQGGKVFSLPGTQETRTSAMEGFSPESITGNQNDVNQVDTSIDCGGEEFASFRALTRRFGFVAKWNEEKGSSCLDVKPTIYLRPPTVRYKTCTVLNNDETAVVWRLDSGASPLSFVSSMYAFYRGGIRFKVYNANYPFLLGGRVVYSEDSLTRFTKQKFLPYMAPVAFEQTSEKRLAEFQVPFYSPTILSVHWDSDRVSQFDQTSMVLQLSRSTGQQSVSNSDYKISVAGADDFDLFGFLGVPLVFGLDVISNTYTVSGSTYDLFDLSSLDVDPTYPLDVGDLPKGECGQYADLTIDQISFS